jgi:hypothetical protein
MNDERQTKVLTALRDLFDAIAEEFRANPSFAGKVQASLASAAGLAGDAGTPGTGPLRLATPGPAAPVPGTPGSTSPGGLSPGVMNVLRNFPLPAAAPPPPPAPTPAQVAKDANKANKMLHNISFDPLECHIEGALLSGREQEARDFLCKLDRWQLEEVVKAQRLPGTRNLQKAIYEGDTTSAVDAIVGSAFERIRSRLSTAR